MRFNFKGTRIKYCMSLVNYVQISIENGMHPSYVQFAAPVSDINYIAIG